MMEDKDQAVWARATQEIILMLLDHLTLFRDIFSKFAHPDLEGSYRTFFRINNQLTRAEEIELWGALVPGKELQWNKIIDLIIQNKENPDVIDDLHCYIDTSVPIIKEYIRQIYPEHYRLFYSKDPNFSGLTPQDLKKVHRIMKRYHNIDFIKKKKEET